LVAPLAVFTVSDCAHFLCTRSSWSGDLAASGVEHAQLNQDFFHFLRAAWYYQLKSKSKIANINVCINVKI
jgi:hypothetical protein